jgi:glycosyltransferase involved in cell wall biosynthesis
MPDQIGIHYVGGGNTKVLKQIVKEKQWEAHVKFYGAVYDDTKTGEYLFASDLMIMPGYLGLAVNHAFAFDCPVISFKQTEKGPFHSPEIEYVVDHETGFLIPELSVEKMADKIVSYFHDSALQAYMQSKIKEKIEKDLTTDKMVKGFTDAVYFVLNKNSEKY